MSEQTTDSGLKYEELAIGEGAVAEKGQTVVVHYTGWFEDGLNLIPVLIACSMPIKLSQIYLSVGDP